MDILTLVASIVCVFAIVAICRPTRLRGFELKGFGLTVGIGELSTSQKRKKKRSQK